MTNEEIRAFLLSKKDDEFRDFNSSLIPNVDKITIIGVRVPILRKLAKQIVKENDYSSFLNALPHELFEENCLHSLVISELKNEDEVLQYLNKFLPYVDNWAVSDIISPLVFKKHKEKLLRQIHIWLKSSDTYTIRYAVSALMQYFLEDDFKGEYLNDVVNIKSNEYYVNMMRAWFFQVALLKQYDATIGIFESGILDKWTHNKAIQKCSESRRMTDEQKTYLKSLKRK